MLQPPRWTQWTNASTLVKLHIHVPTSQPHSPKNAWWRLPAAAPSADMAALPPAPPGETPSGPTLARCGLRGVARGSPGAGRRGTWEGEAPQRLEKSWDPWERILFDLGWFGVISCNLIILILTQHPVEGLWFVFWSAKLNQWFVWMVFDIRAGGGAPHLTM